MNATERLMVVAPIESLEVDEEFSVVPPHVTIRRLDRVSPTFNVLRGFDIHAGVYKAVHQLGARYNDTYTGLNWAPHITGDSIGAEELLQLELESLVVIKKIKQQMKLVKAVFAWGYND